MSDAIIAKDLLLGKNSIIAKTYDSTTLILYMRMTNKRKDKIFLKKLIKHIAQGCTYKVKYHILDMPEGDNDFIVANMEFSYISGFSKACEMWKAYKEIAFG